MSVKNVVKGAAVLACNTFSSRVSLLSVGWWIPSVSIVPSSAYNGYHIARREVNRREFKPLLKDRGISNSRVHRVGKMALSAGSGRCDEDVEVSFVECPNDDHLKFVLNIPLIDQNIGTVEFLDSDSAKEHSPLAAKLFEFDETRSLLFGSNFITIGKNPGASWSEIRQSYASLIKNFLGTKTAVLNESYRQPSPSIDVQGTPEYQETVAMIKEILETRIRSAVMDDGGDIEFVDFVDGVVKVSLKGSCRTCSLSVVTLRDGVERMLKYYVNGVTAVEQVMTEAEKANLEEFKKLEDSMQ